MKFFKINLVYFLLLLSSYLSSCTSSELNQMPTPTTESIPASTPSTLSGSCLEVINEFPDGTILPGKLSIYDQNQKQYGLLDLSDKSFFEIPEPELHLISPDGMKIAGYNFGQNIYIANENGEIINTFIWDKKWTEASLALHGKDTDVLSLRWWNNETLSVGSLPTGSLSLLNINTGEVNDVVFPSDNELNHLGGNRNEFVLYSPTLNNVVYSVSSFVLAMRNEYNDLVWAENVGYTQAYPVWSSDGLMLALSVENGSRIDDIHLVNTIGMASQITNLDSVFNNPYRALIQQIEWSPDNQRIAFNLAIQPLEEGTVLYRLLVYDRNTEEITDYCTLDPANTSFGPDALGDFSIMWSPDGKYIATETSIVDLETRKVYRIPDIYINQWVGEGKTR